MKRIISIILVSLMIFMSAPAVFASDSGAVSDELRNNAALLNALDIADIDIDNTIIDEGVSQKFFVSMIMRSMFDNFEKDNDELLKEMAVALKIVKEGEYSANKLLTRADAAEMALAALGYDIFDGYSDSPEKKSRQALQNGVGTSGKYITAGDAITMICNMLEEKVLYVYAISNGYVKVKTSEVETILSYYRKISKVEDVVTDNGISNLYGESTIGLDRAYVGDYLIDCEPGQMRDYLGMNVVAYTKPDSGSDARLLYVCAKDNKVIRVEDEDIIQANLSEIKYEDAQGKERKLAVNSLAKVIYNGEAYAECTAADLDLKNGFIELIDNDGSGGYDVIKVTEYKTMVAKYVSADEMILISEFENKDALTGIKLDLVNNEKQRILKSGAEVALSQITVGDTLSVAQSKSGRVADIYISNKKFDGYVEKIDKGDRCFTIDGAEYYYTEEFEQMSAYDELYAKYPTLGTEYTFRLDFNGRIASVTPVDGSFIQYGYLTDMVADGVFDREVKFKLFDKNSEWVIYELKNKVRFNGKSGATPGDVYDKIGADFEPQLIQYKLDDENKIKEVNIAAQTSVKGYDGFSRRPAEELMYVSQSTSFANTIFIDNNSYMWFIPEDKTREDLYFVGSTGDLTADATYAITAYNADESGSASIFTVKLTADNLTNQSIMFALVTNVGEKLDSEGGKVNCITCHIDKYSDAEIILGDDVDASSIKQGDILRVYLNPAGTAENVIKLWSLSDSEKINVPAVGVLRSTRALAVSGKIAATYPDKNLIALKNGDLTQSLRMRTGGRILIYYKSRNIAKDASLSELLPNDYAVLFSRYSSIYNAVIIRD